MALFTILIVEDSETSGLLIQSLFEETGRYKANIAMTGTKAFHFIKKEIPDLILLDIMLPDIDGYTILKRLKMNHATRDIPVIMVSAKNHSADIEKAMKLGATDYIVKPIGINNLFERVESFRLSDEKE